MHPGVAQKNLTHADYEAAVDACKWIAAKSPDPLERPIAFKKVFELRRLQTEQGRAT